MLQAGDRVAEGGFPHSKGGQALELAARDVVEPLPPFLEMFKRHLDMELRDMVEMVLLGKQLDLIILGFSRFNDSMTLNIAYQRNFAEKIVCREHLRNYYLTW